MKNISKLIMSAALAIAAGQVFAQATATSRNASVTPAPEGPPIKDFTAARELELERAKFSLGALEHLQKCATDAKSAPVLAGCQAVYKKAVLNNLADLVSQGKFSAAYGAVPAREKPTVAPTAAAAPVAPAQQ